MVIVGGCFVYCSNFTNQHLPSTLLECRDWNANSAINVDFFYNLGFWQLLVKILSSLSIEREKWEIGSRLSAFDSDKQFGKLITKPTMRCCTGYRPSKELFWGKKIWYIGKSIQTCWSLKVFVLRDNNLTCESFVLRPDQTISQGGQVRLSRLPTEDVMVVRQRTNPTKWKGLF